MYKSRLGEPIELGYIEMDPSSRYGRFREILGKGAMKTVYRAFDEVLGMEVAWNQVKLNDVFQSPDELQRLYSEVHLLNNLDHESIMKFHTSWIDVDRRTFNFITEMFTSGTLREYRQRYKRVDMRAVKNWSRQILRGLAYLHGHSPPVIHRDLKCDNIFVNGHLAQVKIGDLGLAAILKDSNHAHSVIGTPEFMAPELYEEDYDERVDVYSFGMCVLEMLTSEYPYNECSNPAQIYKKVTSGKRPEAFHRIHDGEARRFVGKCLESASKRPSAEELLMDPFLAAADEDEHEAIPDDRNSYVLNGGRTKEVPQISILGDSGSPKRSDMRITGTIDPQDDTIFLKVQISDEDGEGRNIYFPFDISSDTALDVAIEMVKELEIRDWDSLEIAEMIDEQISTLVPTWKCNHCQQHSFGSHYQEEDEYEEDNDDDDDRTHHPFYSLSSHSSSRASLPPALFTSCHDWLQDDDASSESSFGYSNINYCSGNEADFIRQPHNNCTRFCPKEMKMKMDRDCYRHWNDGRDKLTRIQSFVDVRRQLLHRTLVEEINKRRMFKTVGAVENIGFQDPCHGFHRKTRI